MIAPALWLLYLSLESLSWSTLKQELSQLSYFWVAMIIIPSWGGQFLRTWRWQLLLGKQHAPFWTLYHALLSGYFVNLLIPRAGELVRCLGISNRYKEVNFARVLGTVVAERSTDMLMLFVVVVSAFWIQWQSLQLFFKVQLLEPLATLFGKHQSLVMIVMLVALLLLLTIIGLRKKIISWYQLRAGQFLKQLTEGVLSIGKLSKASMLLYVLLTLGIWLGYFCTTWFWFLALPSMGSSSVALAFSVMVMGSIAKTLPIHGGGIGAYHYLVGHLLVLFGINAISSQTFALLNHGYQTVFYLAVGGFSAFYLGYIDRVKG